MIHNPRLLKPTGNKLLVEKPKAAPKVTTSGIILQVEQKLTEENHTQALRELEIEDEDNLAERVVIAVGPGVIAYNAGDIVYIQKYSGFEVTKGSKIYLIGEDHILSTK